MTPNMNMVDRIEYAKRLWKLAMPSEADIPPDSTFAAWVSTYHPNDVEYAITKTGKKMCRNLHLGIVLIDNAAARYTSSVLQRIKQERSTVC